MAVGEGAGMDSLSRGVVRGGAPARADSLLWPAKVPTIGVSFRPLRHPAHQGVIPPGGSSFGEILPPIPFKGRHRGSPVVRDNPYDRQAGRAVYSKHDFSLPMITGRRILSSQDTWSQLSAGGQSSKLGTIPYS